MRTLRTITLNSGFDDTFSVSDVEWGGVERVRSYASVPSGKGVNAARAARALGTPVCAYSLVGEPDLEAFGGALRAEGIEHRLVGVPGPTRHNLTLVPGDGGRIAAHMVAEGFRLADPRPVADLLAEVVADCRPGDVLSCNGSVPVGVPVSVWADAVLRVRDRGVTVVVDAQGEAMLHALQTGAVAVATPNEQEVAQLPGAGTDVAAALSALAGYGVSAPVVTLGARGAAFLHDGVVRRASCPVAHPRVAVGAGDAFIAGACSALLREATDPAELVSAGLAAAAAHVGGLSGAAFAQESERNLARVRFADG